MARILVIDDEAPLRDLLVDMLALIGHTAVAAPNGFEALKLFRAEPADLIITDIMMPYDGRATIRILRSEFPQLGIIAMSGAGAHRLDYAKSVGAHQTLPKPFTSAQLSGLINEVLAAHPPPKPESKP